MTVRMPDVHVAVMAMRHVHKTAESGNQAQSETDNETNQVNIRPSHTDGSFKTCKSRSASPGVSRISASRMKHIRESSRRDTFNVASHTSGLERNVSAPLISHRSMLCSSVRRSEINPV